MTEAERQKPRWMVTTVYGDGFHDVFFCLAANMLDADALEKVIGQADAACGNMNRREKADWLKRQLHLYADEREIPLLLRG